MMLKHEAARVVALIAAAYPQWPASRETVSVYVDAIIDLDHEATLAAVRNLIYTEERWPAISTIRRAVAGDAGMLAPLPGEAWAEVARAVTGGTAGGRTGWSHHAVATAVSTIGWWNLRSSTNLETTRSQFMRVYEEQRTRADRNLLISPGMVAIDAGPTDQRSISGAGSEVDGNAV